MFSSADKPLLQLLFKRKPNIEIKKLTILRMLEYDYPDGKPDTLLELIPNLPLIEVIFLKVFSCRQGT